MAGETFVTMRQFIFLPVNLPVGAIAPLAGSFDDEVINFWTPSKSLRI